MVITKQTYKGILATIGQIAPLLGLLGAVLGFMKTGETVVTDHHTHFASSMMPLAFGLAIGVPSYVGYNHLVTVVGGIVLDMEKAGLSALRMVSDLKKAGRKSGRVGANKKSKTVPEENPGRFETA